MHITMDISASLKEIFLKGCPLSLEEGKVSQNYTYVFFTKSVAIYIKKKEIGEAELHCYMILEMRSRTEGNYIENKIPFASIILNYMKD